MSKAAVIIPLYRLGLAIIPSLVVLWVFVKWSLKYQTLLYALIRMVVQLILIGYALNLIFSQSNVWIVSLITMVMVFIAAWIALRPVGDLRIKHYKKALIALIVGGVPTLLLVVLFVISLKPWYLPRYLIPLAGMIFANSMNSVSLCAERFQSEVKNGLLYEEARNKAYEASLLPLTNSLLAVGLVSIPGMMTGQIISGESPLLAARYQIVIMMTLLGSAGIASAIYLRLQRF